MICRIVSAVALLGAVALGVGLAVGLIAFNVAVIAAGLLGGTSAALLLAVFR